VLTATGMAQVQSGDRTFYLNQQQLDAVQRDPQNNRVQVRAGLAGVHLVGRLVAQPWCA
jgi:hypothetical protein